MTNKEQRVRRLAAELQQAAEPEGEEEFSHLSDVQLGVMLLSDYPVEEIAAELVAADKPRAEALARAILPRDSAERTAQVLQILAESGGLAALAELKEEAPCEPHNGPD